MPSSPNTLNVLNAIKGYLQGLQVSGSTFFPAANVIIGKFKDVTNNVPAAETTLARDETKRFVLGSGPIQGGKIDDSQDYLLEVTLDMTDAQAVEIQLANIRDSLTQTFHTTALLNLGGQVSYAGLHGEGEYGYSLRNGQTWRVYRNKLKVRYEYSVTITA